MKCDELKDYDYDPDFPFQSRGRFYDADEVEAAIDELKSSHHKERHEYIKMIAELKARISDLEKLNHDLCERVTENDDIRLHWEEIEQTRAENERLKKKLEDVQATAYADSVDAGMRERRLCRALYKACAMWADRTKLICGIFGSNANKEKWRKMENKCRAKAEEYK